MLAYYIFWNDKYGFVHNSETFETERVKPVFFSWLHSLFLDIVVSKELYKNQAK